MIRLIKGGLFLLLLSIGGLFADVLSDPYAEQQSLFWRISKEGRESYLLGTMHIGRAEDQHHYDRYTPYLEQVDLVISELGIVPDGGFSFLSQLSLNEKNLFLELTEAEKVRLIQLFLDGYLEDRAATEADYEMAEDFIAYYNRSLLWLLLITLVEPEGFDLDYGSEAQLEARFPEFKPYAGLESIEAVLSLFVELDEKRTLEGIRATLFEIEEGRRNTEVLYQHYLDGNSAEIYRELMNHAKLLSAFPVESHPFWLDFFYQKLLVERNHLWFPKLEAYLAEKSLFIAVGTAHLFGEAGLLKLLEEAGFRVEPIHLE